MCKGVRFFGWLILAPMYILKTATNIMKRSNAVSTAIILFLIEILIGIGLTHAQDKRFTFSLRTELADKNTHNEAFNYGFNIGSQIEYQMTVNYFNVEVYAFPGLNDIDYYHLQGTILGFNYHTWDENWRFYVGLLKPGFIYREGPHAIFGQDLGIEHYFNNGLYVGAEAGWDIKTDSKLWHEDNHTVLYGSLVFGWHW